MIATLSRTPGYQFLGLSMAPAEVFLQHMPRSSILSRGMMQKYPEP